MRHPDLGPLPDDDRNSELKRYSYVAIERMLPQEKFIVRRAENEDRGIDLTIEVKAKVKDRKPSTGMLANVQVKSSEKPRTKLGDGSSKCRELGCGKFAYPISTSNLNVILNTHCPLYILYIHLTKHLYYAWAWDEFKRLELENPGWKEQGEVTLHFERRLSRSALKDLQTKIERAAMAMRGFNETVSKARDAKTVAIQFDVEQQAVADPEKIKIALMQDGIRLVGEGHGLTVLDLIEKLNPPEKGLAKICLVRAYAQYYRSRYQQASGDIADALLRIDDLEVEDRRFLSILKSVCDYYTGRLSFEDYLKVQKKFGEGEDMFALSRKIEFLRSSYFHGKNSELKEAIHHDLQESVQRFIVSGEVSDQNKVEARIALVLVEGNQLAVFFNFNVMQILLRNAIGSDPKTQHALSQMKQKYVAWGNDASQLMSDAAKTKNPHLIGESIGAVTTCMFNFYVAMTVQDFDRTKLPLASVKARLIPVLQYVQGVFDQSENIEGVLKAKMRMADFYDLVGEADEALKLAKDVSTTAGNYGFKELVSYAQDYLDGTPPLKKIVTALRELKGDKGDKMTAESDDDEVRRRTIRTLRMLGLPSSRYPNLLREFQAIRDTARVRFSHCRYIDIRSAVETHPLDQYSSEPLRWCVCQKHGHASRFAAHDWDSLIDAFKQTYCESCGDREPKKIIANQTQ